jgi:hypothetical protein
VPQWEVKARAERIEDILGDHHAPMGDIRREALQLRFRWGLDWAGLRWEAGFRSALGSDGNSGNLPRWDQQPSNGTQLDVARADLAWGGVNGFGRLRLGFQELGLITCQTVWDEDLRFLGGGLSAGLRSGPVEEAGIRLASGRVRTIYPGNDVDLAAGQAVLKLGWGAFGCAFHADRWNLRWTADEGRFQGLNGLPGRQEMTLDGIGASCRWERGLPLEVRWSGYR